MLGFSCLGQVINPRGACAVRVTVVGSVCVCVCLEVLRMRSTILRLWHSDHVYLLLYTIYTAAVQFCKVVPVMSYDQLKGSGLPTYGAMQEGTNQPALEAASVQERNLLYTNNSTHGRNRFFDDEAYAPASLPVQHLNVRKF